MAGQNPTGIATGTYGAEKNFLSFGNILRQSRRELWGKFFWTQPKYFAIGVAVAGGEHV